MTDTTARTRWGAYLARAGFAAVETHQFDHDIQNNWYVCARARLDPAAELTTKGK